jgi:hypothetical protein
LQLEPFEQTGLTRNKDGKISRKHGNPLVGTLRKIYGGDAHGIRVALPLQGKYARCRAFSCLTKRTG